MGTHSIRKGKAFERRVAKVLSRWSGFELVRTPMSGAWHEPADITPAISATVFPFAVECKNEEGWALDNLLAMNGKIPGWIAQTIEEAEHKTKLVGYKCWPVLIFTRNRKPDYIAMPYVHMIYESNYMVLRLPYDGLKLIVGELNAVLADIDYQYLVKHINNT